MNNHIIITLLISLGLVLGGCIPEDRILIYPEDGDTLVPVDAIITIKMAGVDLDDVDKSSFVIRTCPENRNLEEDPLGESSSESEDDSDDDKDDKKKKKKSQQPTVPDLGKLYTEFDYFVKEDGIIVESGVFVYLIPQSRHDLKTPMEEGQTYCVLSKGIKKSRYNRYPEKEIYFTTEATSQDLYQSKAYPAFEQSEIHRQGDEIVLNFGGASIDPALLLENITLCQSSDADQDDKGECEDFGEEIEFVLTLHENVIRHEDEDIARLQSSLFTIKPRDYDSNAAQLKVIIDASDGGAKTYKTIDLVDMPEAISKKESVASTAEELLAKIQAEIEKRSFQEFEVGDKSL